MLAIVFAVAVAIAVAWRLALGSSGRGVAVVLSLALKRAGCELCWEMLAYCLVPFLAGSHIG